MTKICTTIGQSKRLLELGLNRKTSDMYYLCGSIRRIGGYLAQDEELDVPAWSLPALLELMPSRVNDTYKLNLIKDDTTNGYYYNYTDRKERKLITSFCSINSLDAAFEMVCWLLENKKI